MIEEQGRVLAERGLMRALRNLVVGSARVVVAVAVCSGVKEVILLNAIVARNAKRPTKEMMMENGDVRYREMALCTASCSDFFLHYPFPNQGNTHEVRCAVMIDLLPSSPSQRHK